MRACITAPQGARPRARRFTLTVQGPDRPGLISKVAASAASLTNAVNNLAVAPIGRAFANVVAGMSPKVAAGAFFPRTENGSGASVAGLFARTRVAVASAGFLTRNRVGIATAAAAMLVVSTTFNGAAGSFLA